MRTFRIVPMQSRLGQDLFAAHGIDPEDPASWLYLENGKAMTGLDGGEGFVLVLVSLQ